MERISRFRATVILVIFVLVLAFFVYTMYDLQVVETGGVIDNTTTYTTITRVKAARGDILDRDGNKLVGTGSPIRIISPSLLKSLLYIYWTITVPPGALISRCFWITRVVWTLILRHLCW